MDIIFLKDVALIGYHGVYKEETTLGQRFIIDISCHIKPKNAYEEDTIHCTISYENLYKLLEKIVCGQPFQLIETLAEHIAQSFFKEFNRLERIDITITKPSAPLPMPAGKVGVQISRMRPS